MELPRYFEPGTNLSDISSDDSSQEDESNVNLYVNEVLMNSKVCDDKKRKLEMAYAKELHNFEKFGVVRPVKFVGQKVIYSR